MSTVGSSAASDAAIPSKAATDVRDSSFRRNYPPTDHNLAHYRVRNGFNSIIHQISTFKGAPFPTIRREWRGMCSRTKDSSTFHSYYYHVVARPPLDTIPPVVFHFVKKLLVVGRITREPDAIGCPLSRESYGGGFQNQSCHYLNNPWRQPWFSVARGSAAILSQ